MGTDVVEFIGLNKPQSALIECFRQSADETKSDIIERVLSPLRPSGPAPNPIEKGPSDGWFDLGQGARLRVGEKLVLYLSKPAKRNGPDAVAEIRPDGFYMEGHKITPSNGSVLQPAMRIIQERNNHRNSKGDLISLSAWRQWYVSRNNRLISMLELKDPALARQRGRPAPPDITLEDLGL